MAEKITKLPTARDTWHTIADNARNATWSSSEERTQRRHEAAVAIWGNRRFIKSLGSRVETENT